MNVAETRAAGSFSQHLSRSFRLLIFLSLFNPVSPHNHRRNLGKLKNFELLAVFMNPMARIIGYEDALETLPGLRDYSGADASHHGHGIDEILDVINQLSAAGIASCVVGVRALRYYGAARVTHVCNKGLPCLATHAR